PLGLRQELEGRDLGEEGERLVDEHAGDAEGGHDREHRAGAEGGGDGALLRAAEDVGREVHRGRVPGVLRVHLREGVLLREVHRLGKGEWGSGREGEGARDRHLPFPLSPFPPFSYGADVESEAPSRRRRSSMVTPTCEPPANTLPVVPAAKRSRAAA